jgi:hypothetical protein
MKTKKNGLAVFLLAGGLAMAAGHAAAIDSMDFGLDKRIAGDTLSGTTPWVNAKFIDLGFLGEPGVVAGFAAFKNTVELQITTTSERNPPGTTPAFTTEQLASFGLSQYPDLGVVQGGGNLGAGQYVNQFYLNFNPAKDLSKLQLTYAGGSCCGFPVSGVAPVSFAKSQDGLALGNAGRFDMVLSYDPNAVGPSASVDTFASKLVFSYDGAAGSGTDSNLDLSDFKFGSVGGGYVAASTVWGTAPGGIAVIGAVPEPGTYAMMGLGLLGLGFAVRRRQR